MKPRLIKHQKLWYCGVFKLNECSVVGIGYTPVQAYDDWLLRELKA